MPLAITCMHDKAEITVDKALRLRDDPARKRSSPVLDFRCIECDQPVRPVRPHRGSSSGMAAHIEHHGRNPKCPLSPPAPRGKPSRKQLAAA